MYFVKRVFIVMLFLAAFAIVADKVSAGSQWHKSESVKTEQNVVIVESADSELRNGGCPTEAFSVDQLTPECLLAFAEPPEYDVVSFDCEIGKKGRRLTKNMAPSLNSENVNSNALKNGIDCSFALTILLSERFKPMQGVGTSPFWLTRRVLIIDRMEPPVFYGTLLRSLKK